MKASFRFTAPNMLAEAQAGNLFVPLGPDLVECVCTLRCIASPDGPRADMPAAARFNPDAELAVVVLACRVGRGEPEYYPPGYVTTLPGAAPIQFLQLSAPLQLQASNGIQDVAHSAGLPPCAEAPRPAPLYADLDAMQRDMDMLHVINSSRIDALSRHRHALHASAVAPESLARPELASRL